MTQVQNITQRMLCYNRWDHYPARASPATSCGDFFALNEPVKSLAATAMGTTGTALPEGPERCLTLIRGLATSPGECRGG